MVLRDASASKNKFRRLLEQTGCHSALCRSATVTGICLWRISSTPRSPPFSLFSPPPLPFFLLHLFPSSFFTSTSSFPFFPLPPPLSQFSPLLLLFLQLPDYRDQICDSSGPKLWRSLAKKCGQKYSQTELKCDQKVPHGARQSVSHVTCSHQIGDVLSPHIMLMLVYCVKASMTSDLFLVMFLALKQTACFLKGFKRQKCSSEEDCKLQSSGSDIRVWSGQRSMERDWWRRLAVCAHIIAVCVHAVCVYTVAVCERARLMKSYDLITWWLDTYCADEHKILCIWAHWNYRQQHLTTPAQ